MEKTINTWSFIHALLMVFALFLSIYSGEQMVLLWVSLLSFLGYILMHSKKLLALYFLGGIANWITTFRLGVLAYTSIQLSTLSTLAIVLLLSFFLFLDFVDGWVATRWNHRSVFGQFLDMESDAFFVLLMCFYYYSVDGLPFWILIPGLLRYVYKIVLHTIPREGFQERKQKYAAYIAGIFIGDLILCLLIGGTLKYFLLLIGTLLVLSSFTISFIDFFNFKRKQI